MTYPFTTIQAHEPDAELRRSDRIPLRAEVHLRRSAQSHFRVTIYDVSRHGCRLEFVEVPRLDDMVWVKFEGLEALQCHVCWVKGYTAGVEFLKTVHPAVFDMLVQRLGGSA